MCRPSFSHYRSTCVGLPVFEIKLAQYWMVVHYDPLSILMENSTGMEKHAPSSAVRYELGFCSVNNIIKIKVFF